MKNTILLLTALLASIAMQAQTTRYVGGDISMLAQYEKLSSGYLDENGKKIADLIEWTHSKGWNTYRVRVFVNPSDPKFEGVIQTTEYVKELGKRIKEAGCYFMLDFHYSDTWVDATHIQAPAAWKGATDEAMADSVGAYTRRVLDELIAYGATPDLVQVGNEIMYGMCGIQVHPYAKDGDNWDGYVGLLKAGCEAVREKCPNAKIIIHTDRPTNTTYNRFFYQKIAQMGVDYDVIGLSYYPFWHGYLTDAQVASKTDKNNLVKAITQLATDFPTKEVQIVETAYNFQSWPSSGVNYNTQDAWECSVQGQYNFVSDLVSALQPLQNVTGISYWFPEEAGNGDNVNWTTKAGLIIDVWLNRGLWKEEVTQSGHALNKLSDKSNAVEALGRFAVSDPTEDCHSIEAFSAAERVLRDGQIFIVRDDVVYDVLGRVR